MHSSPTPREFVTALAPAMRRAAALARDLEGSVTNRPKRGERTSVKAALTVADTAVQEMLLRSLHELSAGFDLEAEEDTPMVGEFTGQGDGLVVLDPIDGTLRCFLEALGPYSVLVGLARGGVYRAAHVALPRENYFLDAVRGEGASFALGDEPAGPAGAATDGHRVLISHDLPGVAVEALLGAGFEVAPASGGAISVAALLPGVCGGLRFMPRASVSVRGRIGALVSREAGALVRGSDGEPFPEDIFEPRPTLLVATDADVLKELRHAAALAEGSRT